MDSPIMHQLLFSRVFGMFVNYSLCPNTDDEQDRANIGNARVAGLQTSLAMSNYQVRLTSALVFELIDFHSTPWP